MVNDVLVYVTSGVAFTELSFDIGAEYEDSSGLVAAEDDLVGFVFGAGVEARIWKNFNGRVEVLHFRYADELDFDVSLDDENFGSESFDVDYNSTVIRVGGSFLFN